MTNATPSPRRSALGDLSPLGARPSNGIVWCRPTTDFAEAPADSIILYCIACGLAVYRQTKMMNTVGDLIDLNLDLDPVCTACFATPGAI